MKIVKGSNRIQRTLEIDMPDGTEALKIDVDLTTKQIETRVAKAYEAMSIAREEQGKGKISVESYGKAVIAFFETIFGPEGTGKLLTLYEHDYTEMLLDIVPFIQDEIMPEMKRISEAAKQRMIAAQGKRPWFSR